MHDREAPQLSRATRQRPAPAAKPPRVAAAFVRLAGPRPPRRDASDGSAIGLVLAKMASAFVGFLAGLPPRQIDALYESPWLGLADVAYTSSTHIMNPKSLESNGRP
jgi:hypothetical protein